MTEADHHIQHFIGRDGLNDFFPRLIWKHNPPDLHIPSSWDYRCEPLCQADNFGFLLKRKAILEQTVVFLSQMKICKDGTFSEIWFYP
jgi:hypothetical protein